MNAQISTFISGVKIIFPLLLFFFFTASHPYRVSPPGGMMCYPGFTAELYTEHKPPRFSQAKRRSCSQVCLRQDTAVGGFVLRLLNVRT